MSDRTVTLSADECSAIRDLIAVAWKGGCVRSEKMAEILKAVRAKLGSESEPASRKQDSTVNG